MKDQTHDDYKIRLDLVFEYIDNNLDGDLSLKTISEIAFFSPYHFHRIFKYLTGETLNHYILRRRIEKSVPRLLHTDRSIIELAFKYGFSDKASFSKAFKKFYRVSPTEFKKQNSKKFRPIQQLESKLVQTDLNYEEYHIAVDKLRNWIQKNADIEVKTVPQLNFAYKSTIGIKNPRVVFKELMRWGKENKAIGKSPKLMAVYHNNLRITEVKKVRSDRGIIIDKMVHTEPGISIKTVKECKCVVGSLNIQLYDFEKAWVGLFIWLDDHGYTRSDQSPFDIYYNKPDFPGGKTKVDICMPIE
ncbi:AraC family transcriptional regulator [Fulvitalea axinellae]